MTDPINLPQEVIVSLPRELTKSRLADIEKAFNDNIAVGQRDFLVDAGELTFMTSGGVGLLTGVLNRVRKSGGSLRIRGLHGDPLQVFKTSRLDSFLNLEYEARGTGQHVAG